MPLKLNLTFFVRSAYDPLIVAGVITKSSLNLGLRKQDLRAVGFTLMIVFTLLSVQPIIQMVKLWRASK